MKDTKVKLTYGEEMVKLESTDTGHLRELKESFAKMIDRMRDIANSPVSSQQKQTALEAINQIVTAQMWAERAETWTD